MRSRATARAALSILAALFALSIAEAAVRVIAPQWTLTGFDFFAPDAELGWRLAPDYSGELSNVVEYRVKVRTDALGLRTGSPQAGPIVLGLGDSFMFGFGVEADQSFLALAAREVGARAANAGTPSYGPCQESELGVRLLGELKPSVVVLSVFLGNDEQDALDGISRKRVDAGSLVSADWQGSPARSLLHPLFLHSQLVRMVRFSRPVTWVEQSVFGRPDRYRSALRQDMVGYLRDVPRQLLEADSRAEVCYAELAHATALTGTRLVALLVPSWDELDPARLEADGRLVGLGDFDATGPARRLTAALRAAGISEIVDARPALRSALERGERLYFPIDRHLDVLGNARLAEVLAAALAESSPHRGPGSGSLPRSDVALQPLHSSLHDAHLAP